MRSSALIAAAVAAAVVLNVGTTAAAAPPPLVLRAADSGRSVTLAVGQRLRIELNTCYGCGYSWHTLVAPSKRILRRRPTRKTPSSCQPPCVGGSGDTIFRYVARAHGKTRLRLGYIPPGDQPATNLFELRVRVR
jgi:predicted secreted protein